MEAQALFCRHCGQAAGPKAISTGQTQAAGPAQLDQQSLPDTTQSAKAKRRPTASLLLVGIVLMLFGLRVPAIALFGASAAGVVTDREQRVDTQSSRMDYNYDITYQFTTREGKTVKGSYRMNRVYDVRKLPVTGSQVRVKYVPGMDYINMIPDQEGQILGVLFLIGAGTVVLVMGLRGVPVTFRRTRAR